MTEVTPDTAVGTVEDTVTIDNVEYKTSDLTENQQRLIDVYKSWKDEELVVQKDVMKLQAAQREMAREIVLDVRRTLEAKAAAAEAAAEEARAAAEKANGKDLEVAVTVEESTDKAPALSVVEAVEETDTDATDPAEV